MAVPHAATADMVQGMFDLSAPPASLPSAARDDSRLSGNVMSGGLGALLASFGVVAAPERDEVADAVEQELAARGHCARVTKLRFSTLYLEAGPQEASLLRFDVEMILEALAVRVPGQVERIVVRVATGSADVAAARADV